MTVNHDDDGDGDDGDDDDNDDYDIDLYVVCVVDGWIDISSDEVGVVGKPAHQEQGHHPHHHLHNLMREDIDVVGGPSDHDPAYSHHDKIPPWWGTVSILSLIHI